MEKLNEDRLEAASGGAKREKYVSAFYCEDCRTTVHLPGVYSLDRAIKEHNKQFHPELLTAFSQS